MSEDRISPQDLEHHRFFARQAQEAQAVLLAVQMWLARVHQAYGLEQGDRIEDDGRIVKHA